MICVKCCARDADRVVSFEKCQKPATSRVKSAAISPAQGPETAWVPESRSVSSPAYQFAQVSGPSVCWRLRRNCSVTPAQLWGMYLTLCLLSLGIGLMFWWQGAGLVLAFAGLELLAVGVAFLVYTRHATDGEWISLQGASLVVERETAGRRERAEFERQWVRVEPQAGELGLIEVSGRGRKIEVGRFVRPELRQALAGEIRMALRAA